jgi:hypothetical protein
MNRDLLRTHWHKLKDPKKHPILGHHIHLPKLHPPHLKLHPPHLKIHTPHFSPHRPRTDGSQSRKTNLIHNSIYNSITNHENGTDQQQANYLDTTLSKDIYIHDSIQYKLDDWSPTSVSEFDSQTGIYTATEDQNINLSCSLSWRSKTILPYIVTLEIKMHSPDNYQTVSQSQFHSSMLKTPSLTVSTSQLELQEGDSFFILLSVMYYDMFERLIQDDLSNYLIINSQKSILSVQKIENENFHY